MEDSGWVAEAAWVPIVSGNDDYTAGDSRQLIHQELSVSQGKKCFTSMATGPVLPSMEHSPALGIMLSEYLATCKTQSVGLSGGSNSSGLRANMNADVLNGDHGTLGAVEDEKIREMSLVSRRGRITGKMLRDNFHLPLHTVAKKFGMCTTAFKKLCRRFEIPKWPHRQVSKSMTAGVLALL